MNQLEQLDALMALHERTNSGEWLAEVDRVVRQGSSGFGRIVLKDADCYDTAFIAAAHNSLPAIAAAYRRMVEALEKIDRNPYEPASTHVVVARNALRTARGEDT